MKKRILVSIIMATILLAGCGQLKDKQIKDSFIKDIENLKAYYMEGTLKITNNDDTYEYNVEVKYKKDDNYKVSLINKSNNYEQIIVKNQDGVYVITPSLNKSFKFQSDWPDNNSQSYLLGSIAKDLKNDNNYKFTQRNNEYIFTTKTNYPNNPKYIKQNIIINKSKKLKKVEVKDKNDTTYIEFIAKTIDKKAKYNDKQFSLEEITKDFSTSDKSETKKQNDNNEDKSKNKEKTNQNSTDKANEEVNKETTDENSDESQNISENNETNTTSKIDENVFPLYLPTNTTMTDKEVIETTSGERVIMTFSGDNPFILVQETIKPSQTLEIIPTYGEPFMLIDTVGSLTETSYTWTSNGVEYYIVSDQLDREELLEVAKSINVVSAINEK